MSESEVSKAEAAEGRSEETRSFVSYYNYRRCHKALGNVTPSHVLRGRRQRILQRRKDVQAQTIEKRRRYNRALRELTRPPSNT